MPFKIDGFKSMKTIVNGIRQQFPTRVAVALYAECQIEMTEAKRRTPVWNPARRVPLGHTPGSLRASGQVHDPEQRGNVVSVTLSFGNELVDYAVFVHEDAEAFHATGEYKFLEGPLMESVPHMGERVARRLRMNR